MIMGPTLTQSLMHLHKHYCRNIIGGKLTESDVFTLHHTGEGRSVEVFL